MNEILDTALAELTTFVSTDLAMIASAIIFICITLIGYYFIAGFFNASRNLHDDYDNEEDF